MPPGQGHLCLGSGLGHDHPIQIARCLKTLPKAAFYLFGFDKAARSQKLNGCYLCLDLKG